MESLGSKWSPVELAKFSAESWKWLAEAMKGIRSLRVSCGNYLWDGEGEQPVRDDIIEVATDVLLNIMGGVPSGVEAPLVIPLSRGLLQLAWYSEIRGLELEFVNESEIAWLTSEKSPDEVIGYKIECGRIAINEYGKICRMITWLGGREKMNETDIG
ncbi:hypothetical protein LCGC14_0236430 [marine sediment metagenome]|uniref:Uncharacterized protein n=1 Tax=marine sediment metagenome TaxID=412755 RepID=A0A0F9U9C8_9ZZZZ